VTGMIVFLAGATGAIGRRLVPLFISAGHGVVGTTRSTERAGELRAAGVDPVVLDVFDREAVMRAMVSTQPDAVVHQLTDLPKRSDPALLAAAADRNARLRIEGTRNLVDAVIATGVTRFIAQSIAFAYAPGQTPHREDGPLELSATGSRLTTLRGVVALEGMVTGTPAIQGIVLRYGRLYGPGTWRDGPNGPAPLHVDAAANAAFLALTKGAPGIYNIAEDDGEVAIDKARAELGFDPTFRLGL